ncbi:MAG: apolipoprotein N-acyltransferase [Bacteroidales bacterium]|nr:apolipoprotein N-acyltransferase [Bacteroidales bacterium]
MKIRKIHLFLLSVLSGLILALAWPENGFPGLLFIGFVPLLFLEDYMTRNRDQFLKFSTLFYSYPAFFTWNLLTTWWIYNSTFMGAVMAVVLNSLFLAVVFQAFSWAKRRLPTKFAGYLALISFWIAFEYLHLNWVLTWPWLTVGNGFCSYYMWVQWYEYTGVLGGTLWVLVANILIFEAIRSTKDERRKTKLISPFRYFAISLFWIGIPIIASNIIYNNYTEKSDPVNFVVVQPNVDPYSEQYSLPPSNVVGRIMDLAGPELDSTTNFLVAPESAIQESMWENDMSTFATLRMLREIITAYPKLNILIGGSTFKAYEKGGPITRTARKFTNSDGYYDAYNTAILINSSDSLQLYHKSKLTPGVEAMPSFRWSKWLENYAIDLGGTVGSLGTDNLRKVYAPAGGVPVSPIICYESAFGEFFAEFVRNGAQVMIIITNDGWWGNTPGHRQHFAFAHLRAIESRRSIARSANTGISAFIDQRGDAHDVTEYWVPAVIKGELNANKEITFYVTYGDYIARIAVLLTALLLLVSFGLSIFAGRKMGAG